MKKTLTIISLALVASQAFAGVTLIGSRSDYVATDVLRWEDAGPAFTVTGDSFVQATHGTPFDVLVQGQGLVRYDKDNGWATGFPSGEPLLYTQHSLKLTGSKTCNDIGMDIDSNPFGGFTAYMEAFDGLGQSLGVVSVNGVSGSDGYTPFIGVHSDAGDIHAVNLWVTMNDQNVDFAVDYVSYRCCSPVPEPATMSALGLGALALLRRKKSR